MILTRQEPPHSPRNSDRNRFPEGHAVESETYIFRSFELDPERRLLLNNGRPVNLGSRAFDVLTTLVEAAGQTVSNARIMARAWPSTVVDEGSVRVHISALRKLLGDGRGTDRFISNVPGRGYCFIAPVARGQGGVAVTPTALPTLARLPPQLTGIVGRTDTIARLVAQLPRRRFLTIVGTGGIGKTTVALAVAEAVAASYPDGVWFVALASLPASGLVSSAIAAALGIATSGTDPLPALIASLRDKRALLILDNCEHVVETAAEAAETILRAAPQVGVLATSRVPLRAEGEWRHRLETLPSPPARDGITVADALAHPAVELFCERASASHSEFAITDANAPVIADICRRLDGVPLALELAAAQVETFGISFLARGLHDRFNLLTTGLRTALPHQRTLRATMDWSYDLLSEAEKLVLQRLGVFRGDFTMEAASAVVGDERLPGDQVILNLANLAAKSLVTTDIGANDTHLRLFESTRIYALDRLRESGDLSDVARRHANYYLNLLATLGDTRQPASTDEHVAALRRHADEIHVALDWAFSPTGDPALGLALTLAAIPLWFDLFHIAVASTRLEQALSHAAPDSEDEMRLHIAIGHAHWYIGSASISLEPIFARALEIAERIGATAARTQALWGLWAACRGRGDYPAALAMARRFADVAESTGDVGALHLADRILGLTHHFLGNQPIARTLTEHALRHPEHLDASLGLGYQVETPVAMSAQLARILWLQGFPDSARSAANDALAAAHQSGHPFAMIYALAFASAPVALWAGDIAEAGRLVERLVTRTAGNQRTEQWVRYFANVLTLRNGNETDVLVASFVEPRVDLFPPRLFDGLVSQGTIPVPVPGPEPTDVLWNTAELLRVDAELLLWHNAPDAASAAEARLRRALAIAAEQTALSWELRAATSLARLWQRQGRPAEAYDLLSATYGKFSEGFGTGDLIRARSLIDSLRHDRPQT
ncbi:MAG TPA: winged helix-turn-helix domain-containing protein [Acetobacteraceae bacterium]|nr:winged helix-turn-helix domain-containing protein [Acetobacteraceae bacterium]